MDWIKIPKNITFINKSKQLFSDVIRLLLIEKYGGYWVDSTVMAYCSFDSLLTTIGDINNTDLFAYYIPQFTTIEKYPVVENWFFGAKPNSPFIKAWKRAFFKLQNYTNGIEYYKHMHNKGVNLQNIAYLHYLSMHVAAQYVLQKNKRKFNIHTLPSSNGPFAYLEAANWDSTKAIKLLIKNNKYKFVIS